MNEFIIFGKPVIGNDEINEVIDSLKSGWLGTGPKAKIFETEMSKYKGIDYSIALNSATAGLHLSCLALDLKPGDEIITTAMTFCATVNTIIHAGAKPVLVDIDPITWNIDVNKIEEKINKNTKAIIPVHFAGRSCKMNKIMSIAISNDEEKMSKIKALALHGMSKDAWNRFSDDGYKHYKVQHAGFKYNMPDLMASIGIHQLRKLEKFSIRRKEIWNLYIEEFKDLPINLPAIVESNTRHAYHLFNIGIDEKRCGISRNNFLNQMNKFNIGVGVHYDSIPTHPYYQAKFGWNPNDCPISYKFGNETVSIPLSPYLNNNHLDRIISSVKKLINKNG